MCERIEYQKQQDTFVKKKKVLVLSDIKTILSFKE